MNFLAHAVCTNGPDNVVFGAVMSDLVERTRIPKVETTLLGVLPDVYRRSQSCLIERGYQPEGQLHWREEFLSGEIFKGPNPERR